MNNKGFAISTMLYGLLTVSILVIILLLATLSGGKKANDNLVKQIESDLNTCILDRTC